MNGADWVIVAILTVSGMISLMRGFAKEAMSLFAWTLALFIAVSYGPRLATLMSNIVSVPSLRTVLSFVALFLGTLLVGTIVNMAIASVIKMSGLSGTDRVLGMVFGILRGAVIVLALLIVVPPIVPIEQDRWWRESSLIPQFLLLEDWARATALDIYEWRLALFS